MLDSVTIKVLWDRLISIVDEASVAQHRSAFSTVVQEANDFACSIMDKEGGLLANSSTGTPAFVATQPITTHTLLKRFPREVIYPGDVFITNDPWIATGQAMDLTLVNPIFKRDRLVAFAGSVAHAPDLGGAQRWNLSVDVYNEAIFIPLMKLYERGTPDQTLMMLLRSNSRMPDMTMGDLEAQLTALERATERLLDVMDEYNLDDLDELVDAIFTRSERAIRDAIRELPDGIYCGEVVSDGFPDPGKEGTQQQDPIFMRGMVTIEGSNATIDFSGSAPQRPGSFNSVWTFSTSYAHYAMHLILVPNLPNNAGFYRPIKVICPEGTVFNARFPAANLSRHVVGHQIPDVISAALADIVPDSVFAQGGSAPSWDLLLMGEDAHGRPFHRLVIINGGSGASGQQDGCSVCFPANISNTPVEIMESVMPLVCQGKEVIVDSAGVGRRRGGFGQRMTFRALAPIGFSLINARVRHGPQGLLGGQAGRPGRALASGRELTAGSDGTLAPDDCLVIETPGGGGLGAACERDPNLIQHDMLQGLVT